MTLLGEEMKAEQEHLEYLDDLRDSGVTNMFGAAPYLQGAFPELDRRQAGKVLVDWMETFESRVEAGEVTG